MFKRRGSFRKSYGRKIVRRMKSVKRFRRTARRVHPKNYVPRGGFRI